MQYRSKEVVEAIQYTGSNEEEVKEWVDKHYIQPAKVERMLKDDKELELFVKTSDVIEAIYIRKNQYYVVDKEGICGFIVLDQCEFNERFEPVQPFPKEAYELVDDFVCSMTNEAQIKAYEILHELMPNDKLSDLDCMNELLTAIETIKKALGGGE